jgi:hypothetical protein
MFSRPHNGLFGAGRQYYRIFRIKIGDRFGVILCRSRDPCLGDLLGKLHLVVGGVCWHNYDRAANSRLLASAFMAVSPNFVVGRDDPPAIYCRQETRHVLGYSIGSAILDTLPPLTIAIVAIVVIGFVVCDRLNARRRRRNPQGV